MKISKSMIDAVLRVGDCMHSALTKALGVPGQRLSFEEIKAAIRKIGEQQITFPQAILTGDVFSRSADFPFVTLEEGMQSALQSDTGALLRILEYTVAILKLHEGSFAVFDPHARNRSGFVDGNGRATFMEFTTREDLTSYVRKSVKQKRCEKQVPPSEEDLWLTERAFEVLGISYQSGQYSVLTRLLKGTSQRTSARY